MTAKLMWPLAAALLAAGSAGAEPEWKLAWADVWPFDQPHYLILNLAIGGAWGGQRGIDEAIFPQRFEIDYVRVYQQAE